MKLPQWVYGILGSMAAVAIAVTAFAIALAWRCAPPRPSADRCGLGDDPSPPWIGSRGFESTHPHCILPRITTSIGVGGVN